MIASAASSAIAPVVMTAGMNCPEMLPGWYRNANGNTAASHHPRRWPMTGRLDREFLGGVHRDEVVANAVFLPVPFLPRELGLAQQVGLKLKYSESSSGSGTAKNSIELSR